MQDRRAQAGHDGAVEAEGVARLRQHYLDQFDPAYVDHVLVPFFRSHSYKGERLSLPMIDVAFTKENAMPAHLWGLLSDSWKPCPADGVTVFLQGLANRGPGNLRKKIYLSAVTADLYEPMYRDKVRRFFDVWLDDAHAGQPLMQHYLDGYFDLYWDLHLGVTGDAIPDSVRQISRSFNAVLAYGDPTLGVYYDNYMTVRAHRDFLKRWIDDRIADLTEGRTAHPERTFVHYWLKNGDEARHFRRRDVVFECFHNFVAFSQWGKTLYHLILALSRDGDPEVRAWFDRTMRSDVEKADEGVAFGLLERFVMELFRTLSPNPGSASVIEESGKPPDEQYGRVISPHAATSRDPRHWTDPTTFDPDRYLSVPTSQQIDETHCQRIGFAECPFDAAPFEVKDGRQVTVRSSGFGTVYGVVDGTPSPVCDYAGYAPFGFGYRRCPGELLTVHVFGDFLKMVWQRGIQFEQLAIADPAQVPVGPGSVIADTIGFTRLSGR